MSVVRGMKLVQQVVFFHPRSEVVHFEYRDRMIDQKPCFFLPMSITAGILGMALKATMDDLHDAPLAGSPVPHLPYSFGPRVPKPIT